MRSPADEFREAVVRLHRAKDAAYRDAWKRRGEVISVLANIARKVDRLETLLSRADLRPVTVAGQPVTEATERVVSRFGELEACFHEVISTRPVTMRDGTTPGFWKTPSMNCWQASARSACSA